MNTFAPAVRPASRPLALCFGSLTLLLLLMAPPATHAQQVDFKPSGPGVKDYGRPGVPRIQVYLWGSANTGAWTIEEGTDLIEFISVASENARIARPDSRTIRTLKIYRDGYTDDDPFFEQRLEDLFAQRSGYPTLQNGDIVVLDTRQRRRFTWRDITTVTGTLVGLLNTYLLIDNLNDN